MKIEIWSDFVCPFCYIGKRRLEIALDEFEHKNEVELVFKSFELDPNAKKEYKESIHEIIANKYGIPLEQAKASNDQLILQAKAIGLDYNFDDLKPTNTFDAHRLVHFAKTYGKDKELTERLLKAYFVDSLNLSDPKVLSELACEVGVDGAKALVVLESDEYTSEVRMDEQIASNIGVTGVPFFVFNNKYAVSGAQPPELFLEVLENVKSEELSEISAESIATDTVSNNSEICSDGKCTI
ncbi:DsbA family oxidoreductase [Clostridium intestinale]|uniref:DsbA family oxidoreductase n=1 Tax=Clostridium intestinale TaxID=36845 RepID=A0A7D6VT40_9CLOT|nr:DsbA family oxidoreductase [Clostridium intestinale]QLY82216.1 DsbA family oxidoreductase [Clostridium intestinale]